MSDTEEVLGKVGLAGGECAFVHLCSLIAALEMSCFHINGFLRSSEVDLDDFLTPSQSCVKPLPQPYQSHRQSRRGSYET